MTDAVEDVIDQYHLIATDQSVMIDVQRDDDRNQDRSAIDQDHTAAIDQDHTVAIDQFNPGANNIKIFYIHKLFSLQLVQKIEIFFFSQVH